MSEPQPITIETRDGGGRYLKGAWPKFALFADDVMDQIAGTKLRLGDDYRIELSNANATYRWIETKPFGMRLCKLISGHRAKGA